MPRADLGSDELILFALLLEVVWELSIEKHVESPLQSELLAEAWTNV